MIKYIAFLFFAFTANAQAATTPALPQDSQSAVILSYFDISNTAANESSISLDQFAAHIHEIVSGDYNILPLSDIVTALKNAESLPPRTLALTFDAANSGLLTAVAPLLHKHNLPFTVFYSSDRADEAGGSYLNWDQMKTLAAQPGVNLGIFPSTYVHMGQMPEAEMRRLLNKARQKHREHFEEEAQFLAYPFGEFTPSLQAIAQESGFSAAFGLQSGPAHSASDLLALPRFTQTERTGNLDRLIMALNALPLPVKDVEPQGSFIPQNIKNPAIGFSIDAALAPHISHLKCFTTGQAAPKIETIGTRVELRLREGLNDPRIRINCTMPGPEPEPDAPPRWRWLGILLTTPASAEPQ
jgi:peptidoglycan/xylan/chitin deacetylase (PgdA/CDA1 family)